MHIEWYHGSVTTASGGGSPGKVPSSIYPSIQGGGWARPDPPALKTQPAGFTTQGGGVTTATGGGVARQAPGVDVGGVDSLVPDEPPAGRRGHAAWLEVPKMKKNRRR